MDNVTLIVPCYNEQENIPEFYRQVKGIKIPDCRISCLFVDDGSHDNTKSLLQELSSQDESISYISFSRNFGKEAAMLAGLDYAEGDAVVIMDADLQHPMDKLPEMVEYWRQGYDDVCGRRVDRADESWVKRNFTNLFYYFYQKVSRYPLQRNVGDFRLLDKRCVAAIRLMRETNRYTKGIYTWIGYNKKEFPYEVLPRFAGTSTWSFMALLKLALEGITSFSTVPLKIASVLGLGVSVLALCYMIYIFITVLLYGDPVAGYPTIMVTLLLLGGIQLLSLGIIGEYLGKIFGESKDRPLYLVDEYNGEKFIYRPVSVCRERAGTAVRKE
ncbi:MAG: glycosyltransferase family 2 protein [Selenomonadaceae bacterium]|nr:glycosyltransferase family 2 protein [Selenomonadaceae bacterium]